MAERKDKLTADVFMRFMVEYYALVRRHIIETNQFRLHSHGFSLLYALKNCKSRAVTMTKFALELGITKQQLTKLVNDLEEQEYVARSHNAENRRQVYIEITEKGVDYLEQMIDEIINEIVRTLGDFSPEDEDEIIATSGKLTEIFRRDAERYREKECD